MRSAIYEGMLEHHRLDGPQYSFRRRVAMPYLALDELDAVFALHPLWSVEAPNVVSFLRRDFLGDADVPLERAVRDLVETRTGRRTPGPVAVLAHVRTCGWLFNPISLYFCLDPGGERVDAMVADVTNTPWHERHAYVVDATAGPHSTPKALHVSPFFGMDHEYRISFSEPGEDLDVRVDSYRGGALAFGAALTLRRRELSRAELTRFVLRYPLQTLGVSLGIYLRAARLRGAGARVHPHPACLGRAVVAAQR